DEDVPFKEVPKELQDVFYRHVVHCYHSCGNYTTLRANIILELATYFEKQHDSHPDYCGEELGHVAELLIGIGHCDRARTLLVKVGPPPVESDKRSYKMYKLQALLVYSW